MDRTKYLSILCRKCILIRFWDSAGLRCRLRRAKEDFSCEWECVAETWKLRSLGYHCKNIQRRRFQHVGSQSIGWNSFRFAEPASGTDTNLFLTWQLLGTNEIKHSWEHSWTKVYSIHRGLRASTPRRGRLKSKPLECRWMWWDS